MSKSISTMDAAEKAALIQSLSDCIKKHGFEKELKVTQYRETVCALAANEVQDTLVLKIEKTFAPDVKDRVNAFTEEAK